REEITLKNIIGEDLLNEIQRSYLNYLESSAAIYEVDGSYAAALFSSEYCDFLNSSSRKMAGETEDEAIKSKKWICHQDCWAVSFKAIKDKRPCEVECSAGIKIFAAPVITGDGTVIGSNNAGVSNPPTDEETIKDIAQNYNVDSKQLLKIAKEYTPRPQYVFEAAKNHILVAARVIAEFFSRRIMENEVKEAVEEWDSTFNAISDLIFIQDKDNNIIKVNKAFADTLKLEVGEIVGKKCYEVLHKLDKPWPDCPFKEIKKSKEPMTQEVDDPSIGMPLLITVSPIFDSKGEFVGSIHVAKDISLQKKVEAELNKKIYDLEKFHKLAVGRELKMIELKKEIKKLKGEKWPE
ncbi:MAG: PAS domain-containing protein, partial [Candidatus Omnitrophota bacterium]